MLTPDDMPRMETRYATVKVSRNVAAVIRLAYSTRSGDGPYIGAYQIVERITDPVLSLWRATNRAQELSESEAI